MSIPFRRARLSLLVAGLAALAAAGCQEALPRGDDTVAEAPSGGIGGMERLPTGLIKTGLAGLQEGRLDEASRSFNQALKLDPSSSYAQLFNGMAYHLRALKGDRPLFDYAEEGYRLAIRFDASNWLARYYLGLLLVDKRDFAAAQKELAEALLYNSGDRDLLYAMVTASYYAHDPVSAAAVLDRLRSLEPQSPRVLRASAVVLAALGRADEARAYAGRYRAAAPTADASQLELRVDDWRSFHAVGGGAAAGGMVKVADGSSFWSDPGVPVAAGQGKGRQDPGAGDDGAAAGPVTGSDQGGAAAPSAPGDEKMVIVDVVIIATEENITTRKGVNLLDGLTLQFGDPFNPAYSKVAERVRAPTTDSSTEPLDATSVTSRITIPAIAYTLNIANSGTDRNEILARPTLVATAGKKSSFFSGLELDAAVVSGSLTGESVTIQKEVGVSLAITPSFASDGRVRLEVEAQRTFLQPPSNSVEFTYRIETSKTNVNANVAMNFGETLILSGLSEKESSRTRSGVPLLQDVPGVQYLFSQATTQDFQKSVLVLITPRPAQYVYQSDRGKRLAEGAMSEGERALTEFQARYADWFRPYPNWASVFHHLQSNSLYREFRTGDVTLERWENQAALSDRLNQALHFLYY